MVTFKHYRKPPARATWLGFHFTNGTNRYNGGGEVPPIGQWWKLPVMYDCEGKPQPVTCCTGTALHASRHVLDAYRYAQPGDYLTLVEARYIGDVRARKFGARWRRALCVMPRSEFEAIMKRSKVDMRTWARAQHWRNRYDRAEVYFRRLVQRRVMAAFRKARRGHTGLR